MRSFVKPDFPRLPDKLREDLKTITPSIDGDLTYWPFAARMKDGTVLLCVYVVPEGPYIKHWGVYPQQDSGKSYISLSDVDALAESPYRLLAQFANELYKSGESRMGYTIFTVLFSDGSRQTYGTGNALDFVRFPEGKTSTDVTGVVPHEGREAELVSGREYYWCRSVKNSNHVQVLATLDWCFPSAVPLASELVGRKSRPAPTGRRVQATTPPP